MEPCPEAIVIPAGTIQLYPVEPDTDAMLYVSVVSPHTFAGPVIVPGVGSYLDNDNVLAALVEQPFVDVTDIVPPLKVDAIVTFILVPLFAVIVIPDGTVQLYPVAPVTAGTEYVVLVNPHVNVRPVIAPG